MAAQKITKTMVETALRGGGGLVDTLRHSYSMGDLRGVEGNQLEYLPREGDPYSDEAPHYGGSEGKGYRSDSRVYKGYRRGYEGDMKGYESDSRGYGGGDQHALSQSWHEPVDKLPARHGSQYWAGEANEAPRRRQRANTGTYSTQHAAAYSTGSNLLAIEDSSLSSNPGVRRRSGGGGGGGLTRQRQANSMYGTLPRSGRPARTGRQLPETPAPVRRTWHGRTESTREELGRTVSASPIRKREGAKVARPVRRPVVKKETAVKKEEMEDFSMTYSVEADEVDEDQRRKCDIS